MLDRASLRTLARHPERNDPILNVALAEEGDIVVLLLLAESSATGPEALSKIQGRIEREGERVGHEDEPAAEDNRRRGSVRAEDREPDLSNGFTLDTKLVVHPRTDAEVRDAVLARHVEDAFFVLAAAAHPSATERALDLLVKWPSETPLHDRTWLGLIDPHAVSPMLLGLWARGDDELAREAAARLSRDPAQLEGLARDPSRRVRRAVAGSPNAGGLRALLLESDPACEVRGRAAMGIEGRAVDSVRNAHGVDVTSARFKAATLSMGTGGVLASDVVRSLSIGPLDEEGALLAARALDEATVASIVASRAYAPEVDLALAAGIAFRRDMGGEDERKGELLAHCAHALAGADRTGGTLTGKGRLASWLADGVARAAEWAEDELVLALVSHTLAADRMVLGRASSRLQGGTARVADWCNQAIASESALPLALLELAWRTLPVDDDTIARLSARVEKPLRLDGSPEGEVDLDPRKRSLALLERVGAALVGKSPLSPRASLALVALEPRRIRYVLSALPQWKGVLVGANVARVLKAHAGALSAAGPSAQKRPSQASASWTQRRLDEVDLAVALAIGDLAPHEAVKRLASGYAALTQGPALAAGMEARAATGEVLALEPLVEHLAKERSRDGAALAAWLLVEGLDRVRSPTAIAAALDAPWALPKMTAASRSMIPSGLSEALATLERRSPGRLAQAIPQTPRGRAVLASGIARAYRALGGMSVNEV
jgi:hypothetical protein